MVGEQGLLQQRRSVRIVCGRAPPDPAAHHRPGDRRDADRRARAGHCGSGTTRRTFDVASLKSAGPNGAVLAEHGVPVTALRAGRSFTLPLVVRRLRRLIRDERIDTVFSFLVHANVVAAAGRARPRRAAVPVDPDDAAEARLALVGAAVGGTAGRAHRRPVDVDRGGGRGAVVDPAREVRRHPQRGRRRRRSRARPSRRNRRCRTRSGFIGRLDPVKRVPDLVNAAGALGKRVAPARLRRGARTPADRAVGRGGQRDEHHAARSDRPPAGRARDARRCSSCPAKPKASGSCSSKRWRRACRSSRRMRAGIRDVVQQRGERPARPDRRPCRPRGRHRAHRWRSRTCVSGSSRKGLRTVREQYTWDRVIPQYRAALGLDQS